MGLLSLAGKTTAITGASSGIGFAIASRFAQEGASVVLAGRTLSKLETALSKIQQIKPWQASERPQTHRIHPLDVKDMQGWMSLVNTHKEIDILVNCAGVTQRSLLLRTPESTIEELLASNLHSTVFGCKTVGKQMVARRSGGCIINVSSLLAQRAATGTAVYAAGKAGQLGLTTALAQELGSYGVRVNAIVPGYIETAMTEDLNKDRLTTRIPLKRFGTPEEVADAAAFLAKNGYANNCILNLDGGLSAV
ncbi:hypothetical protein VTI74DRAFT_2415 [Chaetomium olivicolor]